MTRLVPHVAVALALIAAFAAGPALAVQGADTLLQTDLTQEQLDALKSVLSGLPRQ